MVSAFLPGHFFLVKQLNSLLLYNIFNRFDTQAFYIMNGYLIRKLLLMSQLTADFGVVGLRGEGDTECCPTLLKPRPISLLVLRCRHEFS